MDLSSRDLYLKYALQALPRLLGLLDRDPFSSTYGCFDRRYWLHRTSDFPSSALQQGMLALALLYRQWAPANTYFEDPACREWALAALRFTWKLQHKDGSFDEWYPQERGWAGPTGYVLHSALRTAELLGEFLTDADRRQIASGARRGARFLINHEEKDVLSNHQAMALLAVEQARAFLQDESLAEGFQHLKGRFLRGFTSEGWSLEYDGPDPGYQTATLSFLARLDRLHPDPELRDTVAAQTAFVKNFFHPDFSFAGCSGSRGTENMFYLGLEYWPKILPPMEGIAAWAREGLARGRLLKPMDQEDHYLPYRMPEFLEAYLEAPDLPLPPAPLPRGEVYLPEAGLLFIRNSEYNLIVQLKKGGSFQLYSHRQGRWLVQESGWILRDRSGHLFSPAFFHRSHQILASTPGEFAVAGCACRLRRPLFTPFTFLLFRFVSILLFRNARAARFFKSWIRSCLITKPHSAAELRFERRFLLRDSGITVRDRIKPGARRGILFFGLPFQSRMVPQSRYWSCADSLPSLPEALDGLFEKTREF